jgi:hypothetical protein
MKINMRKFFHRKQTPQPQRADFVTALKEIENRERTCIKVVIPYETAEKLYQFLKEKGLSERQGIPLLIEYGLSDESEEELEKLKLEKESQMDHLQRKYCIMKFNTYEYFMENKVLTIRLSFLLSKNRSLKRKLIEEGLQSYLSQNEWDNWNEATVNELFRKYVFMNRI